MDPETLFSGDNLAYLEELYTRFKNDPSSVDAASRALLEGFNGSLPRGPLMQPRSLFAAGSPTVSPADMAAVDRQAKVARLINAFRVQGHRAADVDPLDTRQIEAYPELDPAYYGLSEADLDVVVSTSPMYGMPPHASVRDILARLRQVYAAAIGVEAMNIRDVDQKNWVLEQVETRVHLPPMPREQQLRMLEMLTQADGFERFLGLKFQGYKRFSLEGGESIIPLLDLLIDAAAGHGVREVVIGMAHRGRLNVLLNLLKKPPDDMLAEFKGIHPVDLDSGSGDVKYHLGYSSDVRTASGLPIHLSLCFNPSHLEAVNGVVEGRVRAKQDRHGDLERVKALPLVIHGDAAFSGQGVCAEVLNLSDLPGYRTGGTIHLVINNQIGFTTSPTEGRSTPYSTDIARMLGVPIFHVNGEDPEQVAHVVRIALEWRQRFHRDVVIDMYCFRRHGHNETDEPAYTQPLMYRKIGQHPGVREVYLRSLIQRGAIDRAGGEAMEQRFRVELDVALKQVSTDSKPSVLHDLWSQYHSGAPEKIETGVALDFLKDLLHALNKVPDGFVVHPRLVKNLFGLREEQAAGTKPVDWAAAEQLAYATLVSEGIRVRLSGQDTGRGTFSHRHAILVDQNNGQSWIPLQHVRAGQAVFEVRNSLLSEAGVLGFEYGYTLDYPDALVIWEAQFGDFANGAQIIIDNFIVSGEAKWNRLSGLCLFLPHGYEGQGPEHSSARIERFLQMAAENNLVIANCTTPAQLFHLLRRQAKHTARDPLVLFTPKSQLRTMASPIEDLATGRFHSVLGDGEGRKRVVLCSGKVYTDLVAARGDADVAVVRVEQLYPFPDARIREELDRHPGASIVWCQEEPANMGAWPTMALRLMELGLRVEYAGRKASAAPATGYPDRHAAEQKALVAAALG